MFKLKTENNIRIYNDKKGTGIRIYLPILLDNYLENSKRLIFDETNRTIGIPTNISNKKTYPTFSFKENGKGKVVSFPLKITNKKDWIGKWEYELGDLCINLIEKIEENDNVNSNM